MVLYKFFIIKFGGNVLKQQEKITYTIRPVCHKPVRKKIFFPLTGLIMQILMISAECNCAWRNQHPTIFTEPRWPRFLVFVYNYNKNIPVVTNKCNYSCKQIFHQHWKVHGLQSPLFVTNTYHSHTGLLRSLKHEPPKGK